MRAHVAEPVVENIKVDNEKRDRRKKDISAKLDETCRNSKTWMIVINKCKQQRT